MKYILQDHKGIIKNKFLATYATAMAKIRKAIDFWQVHTCFAFEEGNVDETYGYLFIANGP